MTRRWYPKLFEIAADQHGFITTSDVRRVGGEPQVLVNLHHAGHLERVAHGVYRVMLFPVGPLDELMLATLWPRGLGVISHDSALDLWDLCDVNPAKIHVTVPMKARIRRAAPPVYVVHERDLTNTDITRYEGISVVTPARAILDGIERHLDRRLIDQAVDTALRRGHISPTQTEMLTAGT